MNYVIIGGGVAGLGCVEGIRSVDTEGAITLITEEMHPPYSRPGISYWLSGKLTDSGMPLREKDFYDSLKVIVKTGATAVGIDTKKNFVTLENGETVPYDRLLIATGGVPIFPPITGTDGAPDPDRRIFTFTTYRDAKEILTRKDAIQKAVVIGGGLIGLKAAEALNDIGVQVTVLELMDRVLSQAFDDIAGEMARKRLDRAGIVVITGDTVDEVLTDGSAVTGVRLRTGSEIETDAVVVAIGVRPNLDLAEAAGLTVDRGIVVDDTLTTSDTHIYAAGDTASAYDIIAKEKRVTPILPNAYRQGRQAGRNMAGADETYEGGLPMNAIGFYGLDTISIGLVNPEEDQDLTVLTRLDEEAETYRKLVLDKGRLLGVVLVGDVARAGIFAGLIRDGVDVAGLEERMLSPDFGHVHLDTDVRKERLGR
ncbi:MAG: NAD(P)/FAD-dependent oxidoreductase [Deltaproteobacteria bacterium]|nr:NAD(P)/FAD-dependent oxidoreductase [Candidatus Zymogenaceae bacterium]